MENALSATDERRRACELAATEPDKALAVARSIGDPWYRCQALSCVAEHIPDRIPRTRVLAESLAAAREHVEPNRVVTVAAWPLRVLLRSGETAVVRPEVARLMNLIATEPHAVRRAYALLSLMDKLRDAPPDLFARLSTAFLVACLAMPSKASKKEWLITRGLEIAATAHPGCARALADHIHRPDLRQRALLALGGAGTPDHRADT